MLSNKREIFYSEYKKPRLGYITLYPLFISIEKRGKILNDEHFLINE